MSIYKETYRKSGYGNDFAAWLVIPNKCPMCHTILEPKRMHGSYNEDTDTYFTIWFCNACNRPFISSYKEPSMNSHSATISTLLPIFYKEHLFEEAIQRLSANFCLTYNQSLQAESENLDQIAGMGYRKALEFLIKDYCIYKNPDSADEIKSKLLSKVISEYVNSEQIRKLATASAWIGNDETHYVRKFEDKDITDLKRFITATVAFITYELTCDEAEELILSS